MTGIPHLHLRQHKLMSHFQKWFEFDEIKINLTDSTEKNLHLEFTNLRISQEDVPQHISQAITSTDLLVSYKIVKESDLSNSFGSSMILGKICKRRS